MFELLLIRHGQTEWNAIRRVMGRQPIPLNNEGKAQARLLAKSLKEVPFTAIYTSPVMRALQTSQIIMKGRDSVPLYEEPGFAEIDYGDWINKDFKDIPELAGFFENPSNVPIPNGEQLPEVIERARSAIERIKEKHNNERVLAVSHADVIKVILIHYLGLPIDETQRFRIDNCSVSALHFGSIKEPRLICVNTVGDIKRYCHL